MKRPTKDVGSLVEVWWSDSAIRLAGWEDVVSLRKFHPHYQNISVGFVIADGKKGITLVGSIDGHDRRAPRATNAITIPAHAIIKRRRLR